MGCTEYPLCKYAFYEKQPNKMIVLKCSKVMNYVHILGIVQDY